LSKEEGGGYLVEYPDIPGCMSDGETVEEAITNGREALLDCLEVFKESGRKIPRPSIEAAQSEENFVEWRRPGRGGSHVIFSAPGVREIVSAPAKRPIKPVYIRRFVALIDAAGGVGTK
jgi:predicted RNase H-like HicB family nuclease